MKQLKLWELQSVQQTHGYNNFLQNSLNGFSTSVAQLPIGSFWTSLQFSSSLQLVATETQPCYMLFRKCAQICCLPRLQGNFDKVHIPWYLLSYPRIALSGVFVGDITLKQFFKRNVQTYSSNVNSCDIEYAWPKIIVNCSLFKVVKFQIKLQ